MLENFLLFAIRVASLQRLHRSIQTFYFVLFEEQFAPFDEEYRVGADNILVQGIFLGYEG